MSKAAAIIAAGGSSLRMDGENKLFADLGGIPVLIRAVSAFEKAKSVDEIIIAAKPENKEKIRALCAEYGITKLTAITGGGENRQASVLGAVRAVHRAAYGSPQDSDRHIDVIAVHDGARPFVSPEDIDNIIALAREKGAVIPAVKVKETVKAAKDGKVFETPDRDGLYLAQTPQVFSLSEYMRAVEYFTEPGGEFSFADYDGAAVTDDASMLEKAGFDVFITEGNYRNIKITTPEDLAAARSIITDMRVGTGYDVHRLVKGRRLILCGVDIPNETGLLGHSDADVASHALTDALLGALALGDIGVHFPDNSPEYKDISSIALLRRVIGLIADKGYTPSNLDITIIAESPKLAPFIPQMRENIAAACGIPPERVSVKATTEEGLGLAGRGIGANAVCMLINR